MSLYGYKPKTKPALWQTAFPAQVRDPITRQRPAQARQTRIAPRSKAGKVAEMEYKRTKTAWWKTVKGTKCPVAREIFRKSLPVDKYPHHMRGRNGPLLCDARFWLACSQAGHNWIHQNIEMARARGWIADKGDWGKAG